jgi:hypothetical protein
MSFPLYIIPPFDPPLTGAVLLLTGLGLAGEAVRAADLRGDGE